MKRIFWALMALGMLAGCANRCHEVTWEVCKTPYWQVVLMDVEGCWISEYIAEGEVKETCGGYCFRAVQRRIFKPVTLTFKYPLGRPVKVTGADVIVKSACKPLWLQEMDRHVPPPNRCGQSGGCQYKKGESWPTHPFFWSSREEDY